MEISTWKNILDEAKHIGIKNDSFNRYAENVWHENFTKALNTIVITL